MDNSNMDDGIDWSGSALIKAEFVDDYERLPASASADHAHIIDVVAYYNAKDLSIAEYNLSI
jgi:hypothetical protein